MSNNIREPLEIIDLNAKIHERNDIIRDYLTYGVLDRHTAIEKIRELQTTDSDIATATVTAQAVRGSVILEYADNKTLIKNLQFQIDFLNGKLIDKSIKNFKEN